MDITFLITTRNRQKSCQELVDSLRELGNIIVANDGSNYSVKGAVNLNTHIHLGKKNYWKLINMLFRNRTEAKYYFVLPDDFLICDSQIAKAIEIWESIKDDNKICLNLYYDRNGKRCWTNFLPVNKGDIWQTQWVDMCFLCENMFFERLGAIPELNKTRNMYFKGSSGVGCYISRFFNRKKMNLYQVKESLVDMQEEHCYSQMHKTC